MSDFVQWEDGKYYSPFDGQTRPVAQMYVPLKAPPPDGFRIYKTDDLPANILGPNTGSWVSTLPVTTLEPEIRSARVPRVLYPGEIGFIAQEDIELKRAFRRAKTFTYLDL